MNSALSRRDFLKITLALGGCLTLSPLLEACSRSAPATPAATGISTSTALPSADDLLAGLEGQGIDAFIDEAFRRWSLRDPENLTALGLSRVLGATDAELTDISDAALRRTQAFEAGALDLLRAYDASVFSPAQALTARIYDWYLEDLVRGHPYLYADYPVNPIITSIPFNLNALFTLYHPLDDCRGAEAYLSRLSQVGAKLAALVDGLRRRETGGVVLPAFMFSYVLPDIRPLAGTNPAVHPWYRSFEQRLTGVSSAEKRDLLDRAADQVASTVAPAYQALVDFLDGQASRASSTVGVWQFPDGESYYAWCLRHHSTTDLSAAEIHELGKEHVARIREEMDGLFSKLGYSPNGDLQSQFNRLAGESGLLTGQDAVTTYENAIRGAAGYLPQAFSDYPRAEVRVVGGRDGDYYMPASLDGSRPGLFFARTDDKLPGFQVRSTAFHETVPGHHLQISLAQEQEGLPAFRRFVQFNAYVEGWGLYAERLMAELGAYADDPQGDLGRLQMEAYRAARLVVDTGIHAMHWDFDQAVDTLVQATGFPIDSAQREITRYCVWPGQATSYYLGFLKLLDLRQKTADTLGAAFDLKEFHRLVLAGGSMPLSILENLVEGYIAGAR